MKYFLLNMFFLTILLFMPLTVFATEPPITIPQQSDDVCSKPHDQGTCYALLYAWFYNTSSIQCEEFVYGGCGGNENRFATEEQCYAKCIERLVELHPPQNVRVGMIQDTQLFIYWYPPINIQLHVDVTNSNPGYDTGTGTSNSSATDGSHVVVHELNTSAQPPTSTEAGDTNRTNSSNRDGNSTGSQSVGVNHTTDGNTNKTSDHTSGGDNSNETDSTGKSSSVANTTIAPEIAGRNLSILDYIGKKKVPFHFAKLDHYIVSYQGESETKWHHINVSQDVIEANLTGLKPSTLYHVKVSAVYLTNSSISTSILIIRTTNTASRQGTCHCDEQGTIGGYKKCNLSLTQNPWCPCKKSYVGLFCEMCASGYYRTANSLPCHPCPCEKRSSLGSCHFGYLHCTRCHDAYTGNLCHRCANGYYRDTTVSPVVCKKCEGCHNITPGLICNPFNGTCLNCHYNTVGERCDRCLPGYIGDPLKNIPCVAPKTHPSNKFQPPSPGIIAAIVVATIVILSAIVGIIVYRRMQSYPTHRPFWTIELQEDHEGVNFSSVPGDDMEHNRDDARFYERNKTKSPPYAQLKEEF